MHMELCEAVEKPGFAKAVRKVRELVFPTSTDEDLALGSRSAAPWGTPAQLHRWPRAPLPRPETVESLSEGGSSRRTVRASELSSTIHDRDEWFLLRRIDDLTNDAGHPKLAKQSNDKQLLQKADKLLSQFAVAGTRA